MVLPSGDQLVIPEWMLDEELCRGMELVEQPIPSLSALVALRSLLDAQPISDGPGSVASEASSPGGASCEPTTPGSSPLGDPQKPGASAGSADTLPRVTQSYAARGRERNNRKGDR